MSVSPFKSSIIMHFENRPPTVGIDDLSVYIPSLYLPIQTLAIARDIDPDKLEKGLGLKAMSIPDTSEDVITMAAEAMIDLVSKNHLAPHDIGRIYVGTESMVDGSKPIASYLLGVLNDFYRQKGLSTEALRNCDVVDMTFACIGAVDAMQNSLDWIRLHPEKKAIVISTDWAKYDLASPGEYTQGAGSVAVLLSADPRIMEIHDQWGVSAQHEHDFYKPLRRNVKMTENIVSNGVAASLLGRDIVLEHKETPIYDGQYSNECYRARITEALEHFEEITNNPIATMDRWSKMIFHLPYAYHARRMFTSLFIDHLRDSGEWNDFVSRNNIESPAEKSTSRQLTKAVSRTYAYRNFVNAKIEAGERASSLVGNLYTGSVFLSLISTLESEADEDLSGTTVGFFAYGSGSKAKVFEGTLKTGYRHLVERIGLFDHLAKRKEVSFDHYLYLHRDKLLFNLDSENRSVFQTSSGWTETNKYARNYSIVNKD